MLRWIHLGSEQKTLRKKLRTVQEVCQQRGQKDREELIEKTEGQKRDNREDKWTGRSWQRVQKDKDELTGQKDRDSQHRGQKDSGHS